VVRLGAIFFSGEMFGENCSVSGALSQHFLTLTLIKRKQNLQILVGKRMRSHMENSA
jgi:hypothetical protein